jgi:hypothetical protein
MGLHGMIQGELYFSFLEELLLKFDFSKKGCKDVDWIHLGQDSGH